MALPRNTLQEGLCRAYVQAITAQAGAICATPSPDFGIDLCIRDVMRTPDGFDDVSRQIDLQLKSTTRAISSDTEVAVDLDARMYNSLCRRSGNIHQFLVVLVLPPEETEWLTHTPEELIVRRCAYWISLEGRGPTSATSSVRVRIPRENIFTAEVVQQLLVEA